MEFTWFITYFKGQSFWWATLICPALLIVVGLVLAIFHAKKAYLPLAVALGGAQLFLLCNFFGEASASDAHMLFIGAWAGIYLVLCVLVRLLFLIPFRREKRKDRAEEIYRKFRVGLELSDDEARNDASEDIRIDVEESVRMQHILDLLEKLRACKLSASDRLETDAISRTLDAFRGKQLTADDLPVVNDSLASVLRMTAKYKL